MCGIAGIWGEPNDKLSTKMIDRISYRGPDNTEVVTSDNYSLGFARLAIYGDKKSRGIHKEKDLTVAFNGEIYNVGELRNKLEDKGIKFKTDLEVEVLANAYKHWKLDFPKHVKGMFAITIIDNDKVVLARDRMGIKPMYYSITDNGDVLFASEIKSITNNIKTTDDEIAIEESNVFGYVSDQDRTLYNDIKQVEPGQIISLNKKGIISENKYYTNKKARYSTKKDNYNDSIKELKEHIKDSFKQVFEHGNMDKGIYLSGGLDSSIIAYTAKELGYDLPCFTIADSETDDLKYAKKVAETLGLRHYILKPTKESAEKLKDDLKYHYEGMISRGIFDINGPLAFHLISEFVGKRTKVAISGDGADELFGGYYWAYTHPLGFADRIRDNYKKYGKSKHVKDIIDKLFPLPEDEDVYRRNIFDFLIKGGLSNYHLQSVDRSSGAFGFEVRPIFLNDDLVKYTSSIPIDFKVENNDTKKILRETFRKDFKKIGLEEIIDRRKVGLPSSIDIIGNTDYEPMKHPIKHPTVITIKISNNKRKSKKRNSGRDKKVIKSVRG